MFTVLAGIGVLAALLIGVVAGIYVAFSVSVLPGLDLVPAERSVQAMRSINRVIQNPVFFTFLFGALIVPAVAAVLAFVAGQPTAGWLFVAAAVIYLVGSFGVTVTANVPLNNQLENGGEPDSESGVDGRAPAQWLAFSPRWTRWNTVRSVASLVSLVAQLAGLVALA